MSSTTSKTCNYGDTKNNGTIDFHNNQGVHRKFQNVSDINNKQYLTSNNTNKNRTECSERVSNDNNLKEIAIPLSAELNIPKDTKNQDFTSLETSGSNEKYNTEENTNNRMRVPITGVRYSDDVNYNRAEDMFDSEKAYGASDYNRNKLLSDNNRDSNQDSQNSTMTATANQGKDLNMDGKRISQEKADILNKLKENIDANESRNSVDANKQQFLSKRRNISVSSNTFQNRDVASPSLLVKVGVIMKYLDIFLKKEVKGKVISNYNINCF